MKLTTKIKLLFSKKLRDKLSCVGCELPCGGGHKIKKDIICNILVYEYENRKRRFKK